jgi:hypothetical protein
VAKRQPRDAASANPSASGSRTRFRLGVCDHDPLSERAPSGEPRLFLPVADLVVTYPTLCTRSARVDERGRHAIADRPSADVGATWSMTPANS